MKKRIISAVLAAALTLSAVPAFAGDYYGDAPLPDIYFSDLKIEPVSETQFDEAVSAARDAVAKNDFITLGEAFDLINSLVEQQIRSYSLAYIRASQHNTAENNKLVDELYASAMDMTSKSLELITELAENPLFISALNKIVGDEEAVKELIADQPTDKFYELSNREQELVSEYRTNSPDSKIFTDENGNSYTLMSLVDEITALMSMTSYGTISNTEYNDKVNKLYKKYRDAQDELYAILGGIFKQMIDVRTQIAKEEGYDNYADYAYSEIYSRDFNSDEIRVFREAVKKYIVPINSKYYNSFSLYGVSKADKSSSDIISDIGHIISYINPELKESFDFMNEHGFLDICENEDRITPGSGYTIEIPGSISPYTFISVTDLSPAYTYTTLIHEFGHYNALLRSGLNDELSFEDIFSMNPTNTNIDLHEVYSQGLELLAADKYPEQLTLVESNDMYMAHLISMLDSIVNGCLFDEWQEIIYKRPDMSIDEITALLNKLLNEYGINRSSTEDIEDVNSWMFIPHNFEQPMYYISYAVSAAAALDLWMQSLDDYDGAVDKYMRLTTAKQGEFRETLKNAGFDDIFSETRMIKISDKLDGFCNGNYTDVSAENWYAYAARFTKPFFDCGGNTTLFRPEENATLRETANTIGALNAYTTGIEAVGTSEFADTPYSPLISWAADAGIINGYSESVFGPDDTLTREQAVTIIRRYCNHEALAPLFDSEIGIDAFSDAASVSDWAKEAFDWAVRSGIINGRNNGDEIILAPQEPVKRSELAQMITSMSYVTGMRATKG